MKKLTILHSNDLHGDFLAENLDYVEEYFTSRDFIKLEGSERLVIKCNNSIIKNYE